MRSGHLFRHLFISLLAVVLLTWAGFFACASYSLNQSHRRMVTESLEMQARYLAGLTADRFAESDRAGLDAWGHRFSAPSGMRLTLILPDGTVAGETVGFRAEMENHRDRPEIRAALQNHQTGVAVRFSHTLGTKLLYVAVPVLRDDALVGVVRMAVPYRQLEDVVWEERVQLLWLALALLAPVALFSAILSRRIARPIEAMRQGAERFARGDFSTALQVRASGEIESLARTLNHMAGQLEERLLALSRERNEREAVLSSMVEGVLAVDTGGRTISLNQSAARLLDVSDPAAAAGRPVDTLLRDPHLLQFVSECLDGRAVRETEVTLQGPPSRFVQVRGAELNDPSGRRIGVVLVLHDISRLRRLEDVRRDFVANVSHELKTPVTALKGFIETLLDGAVRDPEQADRFLRIAARHADRLQFIIEDLLTLSRIEHGDAARLSVEPAPLRGILEHALETCAEPAARKTLTLELDCPPELTAAVNPPLLEQAVVNLVDNAIKYSPEGRAVHVRAAADGRSVMLQVRDQGVGIEAVHLDRIFERFYRVDKGRSRQAGGTGLGLAIVKHIAQAHGGSVSVQSRVGEGSVFSIRLPVDGPSSNG